MAKKLYTKSDGKRIKPLPNYEPYRSEVRRDFARLIHSPCFRRLQGKTQLFPSPESDFFRNRITHSLEVAQIAKAIAAKLNFEQRELKGKNKIDLDLVEVAGLLHDLGHPPFGHNGEKALDELMIGRGGFEGNAQTIRIITKLEKKEQFNADESEDKRIGLNLTFRTIASALKYDHKIPIIRERGAKLEKGYYSSESKIIEAVKKHVTPGLPKKSTFKTIECQIMDIADDIAYSTYDLEDSFKAGFLSPISLLSISDRVLQEVVESIEKRTDLSLKKTDVLEVLKEIFSDFLTDGVNHDKSTANSKDKYIYFASLIFVASDEIAKSGFFRTQFTSELIKNFIQGIEFKFDHEFPPLSEVKLNQNTLIKVEVLKSITYVATIQSTRLKILEHRGAEIVTEIFNALYSEKGHLLLPDDFKEIYQSSESTEEKARVISDFIAGMTDRYAIEFYSRLKSVSAESMFKPI